MIEPRYLQVYRQRIAEIRESQLELLAKGAPLDYPSYRELIGVLQGMDLAISQLDDTVRLVSTEGS